MGEIPRSPQGIPLIGFGTWPLSGSEAERCVATALDLGFRHIDTAQLYGNEREIGRALRASGLGRQDLFLVTKMAPDNLGRERFDGALARSLESLGVDAIDLLLIHWPPKSDFASTIECLVAAKLDGRAKRIGVSNFTVAHMRHAQHIAQGGLVNNQVEFHPLIDQSKLKSEAASLGISLSAYSPLARGRLLNEPALVEVATKLGRPVSQIVLRWIVQQGVAAIPMSRKRENAQSNLDVTRFSLSDADMAAVTALTLQNRRFVSPAGWAPEWDR